MKQIKTCKNCRYYLEHYVKLDSRFETLHEGHCINKDLNGRYIRNKFRLHDNCGYWEADDVRKAERKESIGIILKSMAQRLNEIAVILKDDI